MRPTVRPALAADVPALAELAALTFPLACPPGSTPEDQRAFVDSVLSPAAFARYLTDAARTVLVATAGPDDDALLGYTMLVAGVPSDEDVRACLTLAPTVELSKCYVHPERHGGGVADALMAASIEDGRARGAAGMWLGVNQLNARAQRFYGRHGFARVGVKHFQVGARLEDDFVLERAL
ncbi:GNAT family N-acetyltransferase [Cellulomonas sp. DKR-3]|uniref:GNAT family N-acetyltransferase n=1 Tax=Cellulomonas fulva TaxID=2835530 RepID=A0ABS5TYI6_9CELL|nr:GNAT family N-acetyltransferase [Cellulomonas fulva]